MRLNILVVALALVTACTTAIPDPSPTLGPEADLEDTVAPTQPLWPPVPDAPTGALDQDVSDALDRLIPSITAGSLDADALDLVAGSRDARLAWLISDMLRFTQGGLAEQALAEAFTELTGVDPRADDRFGAITWLAVTNLLIGWDLPAPPDYRNAKRTSSSR